MRYLCIDLGDKRTGIAMGDDETKLVSPIQVIVMPRGTEGPAAKSVRDFGEQLATGTNLPIHFQDERLTSYAADQRMAQTGRTHKQKKELRDALAAAEILRDFLHI